MRTPFSIAVFIIILAIILAIFSFLAISYLQRRPEAPEGTFTTIVEGIPVTIQMDPQQAVQLVAEEPPIVIDPPTVPEAVEPAPVPEQVQPTPEPPTPIPPTPVPPVPAPDSILFESYTVQQGDTLYSIARPRVTSITLMARYGISSANLTPGNVIRIPIGNPAFCPGRRPYAVAEGDTTFSVARRFGTTTQEIQRINNLDANYTIFAASIICVP